MDKLNITFPDMCLDITLMARLTNVDILNSTLLREGITQTKTNESGILLETVNCMLTDYVLSSS